MIIILKDTFCIYREDSNYQSGGITRSFVCTSLLFDRYFFNMLTFS